MYNVYVSQENGKDVSSSRGVGPPRLDKNGGFSSINPAVVDRSKRIPRGASTPAVKNLCENGSWPPSPQLSEWYCSLRAPPPPLSHSPFLNDISTYPIL